ncbi:MAG: hypothetical protein H6R19_1710 [Proteobacteria bacterium]|nr:hypothetical protein [Pseudomonadota bacterium]
MPGGRKRAEKELQLGRAFAKTYATPARSSPLRLLPGITMKQCPKYDTCHAPVCPLDPHLPERVMVRGEQTCQMLRHAVRGKYGRVPELIRPAVSSFTNQIMQGQDVIRIGTHQLRSALKKAMIPDGRRRLCRSKLDPVHPMTDKERPGRVGPSQRSQDVMGCSVMCRRRMEWRLLCRDRKRPHPHRRGLRATVGQEERSDRQGLQRCHQFEQTAAYPAA